MRVRPTPMFVLALLLFLPAVVPASASSAATPASTVLVYGDSLLAEAKQAIAGAIPKSAAVTVVVHAYPGTAPCDFLPLLPLPLGRDHPALVIIETAGNSGTRCMKDPLTHKFLTIGSPEWHDRYRGDLDEIVRLATAAGAAVLFVAPPPFLAVERNQVNDVVLPEVLAAGSPGVTVTSVPRAAVSVSGTYAQQLTCLAGETHAQGCKRRSIAIRDPNGLHFCPSGFVPHLHPTGCAVYSSGAVRFGTAFAQEILATLTPTPAPAAA